MRIGDFELIEGLGRGEMGIVYDAGLARIRDTAPEPTSRRHPGSRTTWRPSS